MKELAKSIWRKTFKNYVEAHRDKKYSFAQSGEDLIVDFVFKNILKQPTFTYFDVGAHHPTFLSNTALFYKSGMKGLCIEPGPLLHEQIKRARPHDVCLNVGIGFTEQNTNPEELDFYIMSARTLNTFSKEEAERLHQESTYKIIDSKKIQVVHLHRLFQDYFVPDFLSVDVEGIDLKILQSIDFKKYRPKVLCIETAEFSPVPPGRKELESIKLLQEQQYMVYADTFNNTIFIDEPYLNKLYTQG